MNITRVDHNIEIMRWQLTYAAYAQYAGMAKMQAAIALQQEALDLQYKNLEILRKKYELGAATRIETENAGISYDKAVIELNKQKRSLTSLTAGFNRLVGENLATTYQDFDRTKLAPTKRDDSVESYIAAALENRSELLLAKQEMSLAQRQAQLYESEISKFSTLDDKQDALQDAEEAAIDYELAVQDVESEINNAYKQLVALRGMTGYYESQIQTAQENYERTQKLFELGMTTAISVDQVRMSVTQAKMQLENNQIDIWQQQQKLKIISGIGPGGL
jgi:outer membrane protein TolC